MYITNSKYLSLLYFHFNFSNDFSVDLSTLHFDFPSTRWLLFQIGELDHHGLITQTSDDVCSQLDPQEEFSSTKFVTW